MSSYKFVDFNRPIPNCTPKSHGMSSKNVNALPLVDFLGKYDCLAPGIDTKINDLFSVSKKGVPIKRVIDAIKSSKAKINYIEPISDNLLTTLDHNIPVHINIKLYESFQNLSSQRTGWITMPLPGEVEDGSLGINVVGYVNTSSMGNMLVARVPWGDKWAPDATDSIKRYIEGDVKDLPDLKGHIFISPNYIEKYSNAAFSLNKLVQTSLEESVLNFIEGTYSHLNPSQVEDSLNSLEPVSESGLSDIQNVSTKTLTGAVYKFKIGDETIFAKSSAKDGAMLEKEAAYLSDAWNSHQIMTVITPKLAGLTTSGDITTLFTHSTKDKKFSDEALDEYVALKRKIFSTYAKKNNSQILLNESEDVTDIVNLAITHSFMKPHKNNPIYETAKRPSIQDKDVLVERILNSKNNPEIKSILLSNMALYTEVSHEMFELDFDKSYLLNADPRKINTFDGCYTWLRPKGDAGLAKLGAVQQDIGRTEIMNLQKMVDVYAIARECVEQDILENNFEYSTTQKQKISDDANKIGFLHSVRLASTYLTRGLDAKPFINLMNHYKLQITKSKN